MEPDLDQTWPKLDSNIDVYSIVYSRVYSNTNVGVKLRLPAKNLTEFKNPFSSKGTSAPSSKPQHRKDQMNYPALFPNPYCLVKSWHLHHSWAGDSLGQTDASDPGSILLSSSGSSLTSWLTPRQVNEKSREDPGIGSVLCWSTTRVRVRGRADDGLKVRWTSNLNLSLVDVKLVWFGDRWCLLKFVSQPQSLNWTSELLGTW